MAQGKFTVSSAAFEPRQPIPKKYAYEGEGENVSPPLSWSDVPDGTQELVLIVDDPDAPRDTPWVHWVAYDMAPDTAGLPEGASDEPENVAPGGMTQGKNTWDEIGWGGPLPPEGHGTHHYHFKLYGVDRKLDLDPGADKRQVLEAMEGHILDQAEVVGTYERN